MGILQIRTCNLSYGSTVVANKLVMGTGYLAMWYKMISYILQINYIADVCFIRNIEKMVRYIVVY